LVRPTVRCVPFAPAYAVDISSWVGVQVCIELVFVGVPRKGLWDGHFKGQEGSSFGKSVHLEREILQFPVAFDLEDDWIPRFERADDRL
jgi:hypothetical protein